MMTFSHGNRVRKGTQMTVDLEPATPVKVGRITFTIRQEANIGPAQDEKAASRHIFSDEGIVTVALDATRLAHVIGVLRGDESKLVNGSGLRTKDGDLRATLHLDAVSEPFLGFAFHIVSDVGGEVRHGRIILNPSEGLALLTAIETSMGAVAFGK